MTSARMPMPSAGATSLIGALFVVSACAPPSADTAQRLCAERARAAASPAGSVGIALGMGGSGAGIGVALSGDYLARRDPDAVDFDCIARSAETLPPGRGTFR